AQSGADDNEQAAGRDAVVGQSGQDEAVVVLQLRDDGCGIGGGRTGRDGRSGRDEDCVLKRERCAVHSRDNRLGIIAVVRMYSKYISRHQRASGDRRRAVRRGRCIAGPDGLESARSVFPQVVSFGTTLEASALSRSIGGRRLWWTRRPCQDSKRYSPRESCCRTDRPARRRKERSSEGRAPYNGLHNVSTWWPSGLVTEYTSESRDVG